MTLKDLYKETLNHRDWIEYYPCFTDDEFFNFDFNNVSHCENFISKFIKAGGKDESGLFKLGLKWLKREMSARFKHIISVYLLGIYLYNNIPNLKIMIDRKLKNLGRVESDDRKLIYMWFMISFFHDLGYKYESNVSNLKIKDSELFKKQEYSLSECIPSIYGKELCQNYYKFRNKRDHGIAAGVIFYKELCSIRRSGERISNLYYGEDLEEQLYVIGRIILVHNIWFCSNRKKRKVKEYTNNGIESLILETNTKGTPSNYPIVFEDYPLLFLFCLIDSIEPLKATNILSEIDIQCTENSIKIITNDDVYIKKLLSLRKWLTRVIKRGNNVIEIMLSNK